MTRAVRRTRFSTARPDSWFLAAASAAVADRIISLLGDPAAARVMGERGMAWVDHEWRWDLVADRLAKILSG